MSIPMHRRAPDRNARAAQDQTQQMLEQHNDSLLDELGSSLDILKSVSLDLSRHIKDDNDMLNQMDDDMDSAGNMMGLTMKRLGDMVNTGGSKHMCYLTAFTLFVFLLVYVLISRSSSIDTIE